MWYRDKRLLEMRVKGLRMSRGPLGPYLKEPVATPPAGLTSDWTYLPFVHAFDPLLFTSCMHACMHSFIHSKQVAGLSRVDAMIPMGMISETAQCCISLKAYHPFRAPCIILDRIFGLYWGYIGIMENKMETTI